MIQGGDPETKPNYVKTESDTMTSYTIPAEFNPLFLHKKGPLAAARMGDDVNPQMRSSGTQFYIVQGVIFSDEELAQAEKRISKNLKQRMFKNIMKEVSDSNLIAGGKLTDAEIQEKATLRLFEAWEVKGEFNLSDEQRNIYKTKGGTPALDNAYTVFGEVIDGLEIVDTIADAKTDDSDKPETDIRIITMSLVRRK
jgi:cyclophilin family peptidyl-prolyl cis-trans isomerase